MSKCVEITVKKSAGEKISSIKGLDSCGWFVGCHKSPSNGGTGWFLEVRRPSSHLARCEIIRRGFGLCSYCSGLRMCIAHKGTYTIPKTIQYDPIDCTRCPVSIPHSWTSRDQTELIYPLVMTNSLPWKDAQFLIGKPSISMGHGFHGYVK
jgi:hypothetical protein